MGSSERRDPTQKNTGGVAAQQLRTVIERLERLEEERKALADDISEVYKEAVGNGFDRKTLKKVIAFRRKDQAEIEEEEHMLATYLIALGMLPGDSDNDVSLVHAHEAA